MKKLLSIMVFGLLFSVNNSISAENYSLFGVMIGDDVNKYNPKSGIIEERLIIDPPKPNKNFVLYWVSINKKTNEIVGIGAYHKDVYPLSTKFKAGTITEEQFNEAIIIQKKCKMDTQVFIELIVEGEQFKKLNNNFSEYDTSTISSVYIFDGDKINYKKNGNIKFSVNVDCSSTIKLNEKDPFGFRPDISLMDHRNLDQAIKDNKEFDKAKTDKSGLQ